MPEHYSEQPSAEWKSDYEDKDLSEDEPGLETIKLYFPEFYAPIEECEDEVQLVGVIQMVKLQVKNEIKEQKKKMLRQGGMSESSSPSLMFDEADAPDQKYLNEKIMVVDYDEVNDNQFSITTPRGEFHNSDEDKNKFSQIGGKTIREHTFEENDFYNDDILGMSLNSLVFSKESKSNWKQNKQSEFSSGYHNSNEKRNHEVHELHSAKQNGRNKLNSERSHSCCDYEDLKKREKDVVHVIGKDKSQVKVPKIPLDRDSQMSKNKDPNCDNGEQVPKSNRSNSSKNQNYSSEAEKGGQGLPRYFPCSSSSRNTHQDLPYSNKCPTEGCKPGDGRKWEYTNIKAGGKDLEVIKENHSEFSNSNSVIETFRNKRKSNISSSGNNSGDQHQIHNAQEMINEEDEEDIENDTTSFRGPKKFPFGQIICEEEKLQTQNDNYDEAGPSQEYFDKSNENINGLNLFSNKSPFISNRNCDQDYSPLENYVCLPALNLHFNEMNNKFLRCESMSPSNHRLSRSFSSEIPSYLLQQKENACMENEDDQVLYYNKPDPDHQFFKKDNDVSLNKIDAKWDKYRFDKEITHDGSQLMKSPSMSSIRMEYKEKTAEFEGEDLSQNQLSEKKKLTNRPIMFSKNKLINSKDSKREDKKVMVLNKDKVNQLYKFWKIFK